jgi:hypothetical protein
MRSRLPALWTFCFGLNLAFSSSLLGDEQAPMPKPLPKGSATPEAPSVTAGKPGAASPAPAGSVAVPPPYLSAPVMECAPVCPPACTFPNVVVELSQPEVHFVAPRRTASAASAQHERASDSRSKICSFLNFNVNKISGGALGAPAVQPVTTVVPAFATATIPIALQTTREFGMVAAARRDTGELSRAEIGDIVREALRESDRLREAERQREAALQREAAQQQDSCAELKARIDRVEKRLDQVEKQVQNIATKLSRLP